MTLTKTQQRRARATAASQRVAEVRRRQQHANRRRRLFIATGSVVAVLAVIAVIVTVGLTRTQTVKLAQGESTIQPSLMSSLLNVDPAAYEKAGSSGVKPPTSINGGSLTLSGKPVVLYIGGDYCPFCAATRWPLVFALSRFGTFTRLNATASGPREVYPFTPTFTFHDATYTSPYLAFQGVELQDSNSQPLDRATSEQLSLFQRYSQRMAFPFVDFGNRWVVNQAPFAPWFAGQPFDSVARDAVDPSTPTGKKMLSQANSYTATICELTNGQPGNVCTAPAVATLRATLTNG